MTIVTPDPDWNVRRFEPAPTRWVGPLTVADDSDDPERDGALTGLPVGAVAAASRTTGTNRDHS